MSSVSDVAAVVAIAVLGISSAAFQRPDGVHRIVIPPAIDTTAHVPAAPDLLRVCADPNNLPFSNDRGEGFENRIAQIVASALDRRVAYFWQPQRRGFLRTTLRAGECDVVMSVPHSLSAVAVTRPYYRSSYVFLTKRGRVQRIGSLDDPRLRQLRIGIQITGDDYENPPAADALAARQIIDNVRGYTVYGDYSSPHPAWGVLEALSRDDVDVAIVWGPLAGYYARHSHGALAMTRLAAATAAERNAFTFDISMGVRPTDHALAAALDGAIRARATDIRRVLDENGVPQ